MHAGRVQEQPLLGGAPERRAVGERGAEVGLPGVQVRVEVHQCDRPEPLPGHAQQRERDRVVAADREQAASPGQQPGRGSLHLVDRLVDVERVARDVTGVRHLLRGERPDAQAGMPGPQQPRSLPDRGRAEPGARPVGRSAVERDPGDGHVAAADLVAPRQQRERRRPGKARGLAGVHRPAHRLAGGHGPLPLPVAPARRLARAACPGTARTIVPGGFRRAGCASGHRVRQASAAMVSAIAATTLPKTSNVVSRPRWPTSTPARTAGTDSDE